MFKKKRNCQLEGHRPMDMEITLYPGINFTMVCNYCGQPMQTYGISQGSPKILTVRVIDGKLEIL